MIPNLLKAPKMIIRDEHIPLLSQFGLLFVLNMSLPWFCSRQVIPIVWAWARFFLGLGAFE